MARPARHSADDFLDAAGAIVARRGTRAVTVRALTDATGAPSGSLFHRFPSLDELVARAWLRAVRRAQDAILGLPPTVSALDDAVAAALAVYDFCVGHSDDARLLATIDRRELARAEIQSGLVAELEAVNEPLERPFARLLGELPGRPTPAVLLAALLELPLIFATKAAREPGGRPRDRLEAAVRATLDPDGGHR